MNDGSADRPLTSAFRPFRFAQLPPLSGQRCLPASCLSFSFERRQLRESGVARLTIHDLDDRGILAFDMRDLLRALAPPSLEARWTITTPDDEPFEATGAGGFRLEELAEVSSQITGDELLAIADDTVQVIWGDFVAVLPDDPHREWLTIRAIDSSFFEVETSDERSIAAVRSRFRDVRVAEG